MTRQEAIKILKAIRVYECYPKSASEETKEAIDMAIEALQDRPSGEWTYLHGSIGSYMTISCPICGSTFDDVAEWKYNYCPNCGARMKSGDIDDK